MDAKCKLMIGILVLLWFRPELLSGQSGTDTLSIHLVARAMEGRIVLRWVPVDPAAWMHGNQYGYQVVRTTLEEGRNTDRLVLAKQLLPIPEQAWKPMADTNHLAVVAAGSLYGSVFEIPAQKEFAHSGYDELETTTNRFSFGLFAADQFIDIAVGMALGFVDTTITAGTMYCYTVSFTGPGAHIIQHPGGIVISADQRIRLLPPTELTAQWRNQSVRLKWNRSRIDTLYTGYFIERSEDSGVTFTRINKSPLIYITPEGTYDPYMYYVDSLTNNETTYHYRVRGKTPFGELGPPSALISGKGKRASLTTPPGIVFMEELPEQSGLMIGWVIDSAAYGRTKGFNVYESNEKGGIQTKINHDLIPSEIRQFILDRPVHGHYYRLGLLDDTGHELLSTAKLAVLHNDKPPLAPTGLRGVMDQTGKAKMYWNAGSEEDLQGYRVYTGNQETGYYAELTYLPVQDTIYQHTYSMNTLHGEEFFKVRAIDLRGNYSEFSKPERIVRPDLHPPAPPAIAKVKSESSFVYLLWAGSSSRDVVHHRVERRALDEPNWEQIAVIDHPSSGYNKFSDSSATSGRQYQYRITATDQNGLTSTSTPVQAGKIDHGYRGSIRDFSAVFDAVRHKLLLSWQFEHLDKVDRFLLYRAQANEPVSIYKTLSGNIPGLKIEGKLAWFEEVVLSSGKRFQYRLLAVLKDGSYSDLSEPLFVDH
ncbi:MAG: hypothetical protein HUU01_01390 [Saprospiraceae bacterium]|nr:hypothetical protein [Saprospiraceae bacterium]